MELVNVVVPWVDFGKKLEAYELRKEKGNKGWCKLVTERSGIIKTACEERGKQKEETTKYQGF